jgi:hypothetical protein
MDSRFPILDRIAGASHQYGPGNMDVCRECSNKLAIERLKNDVANKIADEVEKMCLPEDCLEGALRDLLKLRRGQK